MRMASLLKDIIRKEYKCLKNVWMKYVNRQSSVHNLVDLWFITLLEEVQVLVLDHFSIQHWKQNTQIKQEWVSQCFLPHCRHYFLHNHTILCCQLIINYRIWMLDYFSIMKLFIIFAELNWKLNSQIK